MLILQNLKKFISIRNKSSFHSNLQFGIDLEEAGIKMEELGELIKTEDGYMWKTLYGDLVETNGKLELRK
jgi:hypothetical protein